MSGYKNYSGRKEWDAYDGGKHFKRSARKSKSVIRSFAKRMRRDKTPYESLVFDALVEIGVRFSSQQIAGKRIMDFYLPEYNVCIEVDGSQHYTPEGILEDATRSKEIAKLFPGIEFVRLSNRFVASCTDLKEELRVRMARRKTGSESSSGQRQTKISSQRCQGRNSGKASVKSCADADGQQVQTGHLKECLDLLKQAHLLLNWLGRGPGQ